MHLAFLRVLNLERIFNTKIKFSYTAANLGRT